MDFLSLPGKVMFEQSAVRESVPTHLVVGQKNANPWGRQVAVGSIFPFTNRVFWVDEEFCTWLSLAGLAKALSCNKARIISSCTK